MKIGAVTRDMRVADEGVWVAPQAGEDLEFLTRGYTPRYSSRRGQAVKRLLKSYREWDAVPAHIRLKTLAGILFEECIIDVRGLEHDDGRPATLAEARALAETEAGEPLFDLAFAAADMATARRESDAEDAAGNSPASSDGKPSSAPSRRSTSAPSRPATTT